jgi:superfamily I DNA and/or RNA helicase
VCALTGAHPQEARCGFDLDVSLFERLVVSCTTAHGPLPRVTLRVQHRMRPEISALIRQTVYPELLDHASTVLDHMLSSHIILFVAPTTHSGPYTLVTHQSVLVVTPTSVAVIPTR